MRTLASLTFVLAVAAACGVSSSSNGGSPDPNAGGASDAGAGGVSFGGAQDFGDFKEILVNGGIPGPDTLDANGFFNEHYAAPPQTGCTDTLCLTPGLSVGRDWVTNLHQATLQVAINTNVDPTQYVRRPLDLAVVVDRSGSMSADGRIDKVKLGLGQMIDGLQDGDRMAIVTFSDTATVVAPLAPLDRVALHAKVAAIAPGGGTNIYDGLAGGFDLLAAPTVEREQRVIFLSDGQATVGDTAQDDIFALSDSYITSGIGLTTIGVGADFDLALMRGLAEHGAGNFYFLQDDAATTEVFTEELNYFMSPIALDVSIEATAGQSYAFGEVLGSTLWTSSPTHGSMHVPAVFVASRTTATDPTGMGNRRGGGSMLFIALTTTGAVDANGTVGTVKLTYKVPGRAAPVTQTVTLAYPAADPNATPDDPYLSAPEIAKRYAMYNMFRGLRAATQATDVNCMSTILYNVETSAKAWNATQEDTDIIDDDSLIDIFLGNLRAIGASADLASTSAACAGVAGQPIDGPDGGFDTYGAESPQYGCYDAGGGSATMLLGVGLAALVAARRRGGRCHTWQPHPPKTVVVLRA